MKPTLNIIALSLILTGYSAKAQAPAESSGSTPGSASGKSFFGFNGGIASPMGNFALNNPDNVKSGFAQLGAHFALDGAYFFNSHFGIGGVFSTSTFSLDLKQIATRYDRDYDCDSASAAARQYRTVSLLVGPYFTYSFLNNKLLIDVRVLGGITNTLTPDIIGSVFNLPAAQVTPGLTEGSSSSFVQTSSSTNAFGFQAGIGIRYKLIRHLSVSLKGDYFYSKPNITFTTIGRNDIAGIGALPGYNEAISGISATIGIAYQFGE